MFVRFLTFSLFVFIAAGVSFSVQADERKDVVVILHGIAKTSKSMRSVERVLQGVGYETLNITYPSTKKSIDGIADYLHETYLTEEFWSNAGRVHFVTHSMGGLVTRHYLDKYKPVVEGRLGRVVMLAPPNKGSEVADLIHEIPFYGWYYGPAGEVLTTAAQAKNEVRPYYELGIIAGTKEWPYFVAAFVTPGRSDGRVTVENTKLDGMKDHAIVNGTHSFIMGKPEVHRLIVEFLKEGLFDHEE